ncbi:signal transduction histidine kinase [Actinocorallia herbida]|uniref:histidine kinase n=1 Tax=Actinocorallia herbida TaxID=58109 RepID=A0A3N1D5G1_9ACTN|nr:nitrate- and nitrite sensing domain-containing protein [Actinocorallia herbida]ROO88720.1 signal transduction histidine kinase [Actinocorallia herbida]
MILLWAFAATTTLTAALKKFDFDTQYDNMGLQTAAVLDAIQKERTAAADHSPKFAEQTQYTDGTVTAFRTAAFSEETQDAMDDLSKTQVSALDDAFGTLTGLRGKVAADASSVQIIDEYSTIVDTVIQLLSGMVSVDDVSAYRNSNAVIHVLSSHDLMLREAALIGALPTGGKLDNAGRMAFSGWADSRDKFFRLGIATLDEDLRAKVTEFADSEPFGRYVQLEGQIRNGGINAGKTGATSAQWQQAVANVEPAWYANMGAVSVMLDEQIAPVGDQIMLRFYAAGGIGLIAVIASLLLSVRFARSMTGDLRVLERAAHTLADERLPEVVARLRAGENIDVSLAEQPLPGGARTKEVGSVADAFATVQHTAVDVAIGEARLRRSIGRVFVNLSWRSQGLLQRQLQLLDTMERRASSPEELDDLFKLDHLTTRMRRHAEGLVILSGEPTVRAFDHPVPIEDVVRAAIGEVEDYTRVEPAVARSSSVTGAVVADVIHLLAELIENATVFSPPGTEVLVKAEAVANGLAVEVIDRGLGLYPDQLAELNRRLAEPPEFDLADSDRLGLFVVARLAARHGIRVALQPSAYGGTTAVVLIPSGLTVQDAPSRPAVNAPRSAPPPSPAVMAAPERRPVPLAAPARAADNRFEPDATPEQAGRLPRRRKQQSMAPQLRTETTPPPVEDDFEEPDPESSRALMSSLQYGWARGRDGQGDDPTDERNRP